MYIPKDGWTDDRVEDMKEANFSCEHCKKEKIRFVHVLTHPQYEGELHVGCVCAGKLTGNIELSKQKERERRNESKKFEAWQKRKEREENEKPRFFESFEELKAPGKKNWYKGTLDDRLHCIIWLGSYGNWGFGIHKDPNHQFRGSEWIWTDSTGHKAFSLENAKEMAWEYISINKEALGLAPRRDTSKYIKTLRSYGDAHNLSQTELGSMLGVSASCISKWLTGAITPDEKSCQKIMEVCNKEPKKEEPAPVATKMDLPTCMYKIAQNCPDFGVDPQEAYVLGQTYRTVIKPEGLILLKITGYKYYREIEEAPGYDSPALRILNLARSLCEG